MKISLTVSWLFAFPCWAVAQEPAGKLIKPDRDYCWAVAQEPVGVLIKPGADYQKGYHAGRAEADEQLIAGKATLYTYGLRRHDEIEFLDRETGLPFEPVAGCVVNETIHGRAAGHNDRIREFIAERGLPRNSFKRWEKDLFDLKGYYDAGRRRRDHSTWLLAVRWRSLPMENTRSDW